MSVLLDINGTEFAYPEVNDQAWGADATDWAVAVTNGMLQKQGGLFLLLDDVDFGTNFGLISKYFTSRTANAASSGVVRLANTDAVSWRNGANGADLALAVSADALTFNGAAIGNFVSVSDTATIDLTLAAGVLSADVKALSITNSLVSASAAIAVSKLAALTASRAVVTDGSGLLSAATTTATEIGYVNGVTSSIQTQLNGKQATGNYITALTGDGTASGPGSAALTLATVNSNVGTFASATVNGKGLVTAAANLSGDITSSGAVTTLATVNSNVGSFGSSTAIPSVTVNAKGLVTAASTNAVVAPAGTLTGTTLASNVVSSSLTSVGTITSGTWTGTTIALANGGTGQTTKQPAFDALSPLSTKGDIAVFSTVGTRLGVGANGTVLTADSAQTTGLSWTSPLTNPMNAVGDVIIGGSSGAATRLGIGTTGQFLTVVSGSPAWTGGNFAPISNVYTAGATWNPHYIFTITSGSASANATYTNNGITFTVYATVASATQVIMYGNGAPTASGTLTKASGTGDSTITFSSVAAPLYLDVQVQGSGGAGGGAATTTAGQMSGGGGGGAGSYSRSVLRSGFGTAQTVTVGAGGTGVSGTTGNSGNASSFGSLVTASGGGGGSTSAASSSARIVSGGSGAGAGTGDTAVLGGDGFACIGTAGGVLAAGSGGASFFGGGAVGATVTTGASVGGTGRAYGSGGGGSGTGTGGVSANSGGTGAGGLVVVIEHYQ